MTCYEGKGEQKIAYLISELFRSTLSDDAPLNPQINAMMHTARVAHRYSMGWQSPTRTCTHKTHTMNLRVLGNTVGTHKPVWVFPYFSVSTWTPVFLFFLPVWVFPYFSILTWTPVFLFFLFVFGCISSIICTLPIV